MLLSVLAVGRGAFALPALIVFATACAAMNLGAFPVIAPVGRQLEDFVGFSRASPWCGGELVIFLLSLVVVLRWVRVPWQAFAFWGSDRCQFRLASDCGDRE